MSAFALYQTVLTGLPPPSKKSAVQVFQNDTKWGLKPGLISL